MNDRLRDLFADDSRSIDRLVDGELGEDESRELLARLDNQADGWRRCALAFLEAQCWRHAFRHNAESVALEPVPTLAQDAVMPSQTGRRWRAPSWRSVLALAATFFIAFSLGLAMRKPARTVSQHTLAHVDSTVSRSEPARWSAGGSPSETAPESEVADSKLHRTVGLLAMTLEDEDRELACALPVIEGPGIDVDWLLSQPSVVPEPVRRKLENMGHRIIEHRELINLLLEDGRHVVVPVNQVQVKFASRVYQ